MTRLSTNHNLSLSVKEDLNFCEKKSENTSRHNLGDKRNAQKSSIPLPGPSTKSGDNPQNTSQDMQPSKPDQNPNVKESTSSSNTRTVSSNNKGKERDKLFLDFDRLNISSDEFRDKNTPDPSPASETTDLDLFDVSSYMSSSVGSAGPVETPGSPKFHNMNVSSNMPSSVGSTGPVLTTGSPNFRNMNVSSNISSSSDPFEQATSPETFDLDRYSMSSGSVSSLDDSSQTTTPISLDQTNNGISSRQVSVGSASKSDSSTEIEGFEGPDLDSLNSRNSFKRKNFNSEDESRKKRLPNEASLKAEQSMQQSNKSRDSQGEHSIRLSTNPSTSHKPRTQLENPSKADQRDATDKKTEKQLEDVNRTNNAKSKSQGPEKSSSSKTEKHVERDKADHGSQSEKTDTLERGKGSDSKSSSVEKRVLNKSSPKKSTFSKSGGKSGKNSNSGQTPKDSEYQGQELREQVGKLKEDAKSDKYSACEKNNANRDEKHSTSGSESHGPIFSPSFQIKHVNQDEKPSTPGSESNGPVSFRDTQNPSLPKFSDPIDGQRVSDEERRASPEYGDAIIEISDSDPHQITLDDHEEPLVLITDSDSDSEPKLIFNPEPGAYSRIPDPVVEHSYCLPNMSQDSHLLFNNPQPIETSSFPGSTCPSVHSLSSSLGVGEGLDTSDSESGFVSKYLTSPMTTSDIASLSNYHLENVTRGESPLLATGSSGEIQRSDTVHGTQLPITTVGLCPDCGRPKVPSPQEDQNPPLIVNNQAIGHNQHIAGEKANIPNHGHQPLGITTQYPSENSFVSHPTDQQPPNTLPLVVQNTQMDPNQPNMPLTRLTDPNTPSSSQEKNKPKIHIISQKIIRPARDLELNTQAVQRRSNADKNYSTADVYIPTNPTGSPMGLEMCLPSPNGQTTSSGHRMTFSPDASLDTPVLVETKRLEDTTDQSGTNAPGRNDVSFKDDRLSRKRKNSSENPHTEATKMLIRDSTSSENTSTGSQTNYPMQGGSNTPLMYSTAPSSRPSGKDSLCTPTYSINRPNLSVGKQVGTIGTESAMGPTGTQNMRIEGSFIENRKDGSKSEPEIPNTTRTHSTHGKQRSLIGECSASQQGVYEGSDNNESAPPQSLVKEQNTFKPLSSNTNAFKQKPATPSKTLTNTSAHESNIPKIHKVSATGSSQTTLEDPARPHEPTKNEKSGSYTTKSIESSPMNDLFKIPGIPRASKGDMRCNEIFKDPKKPEKSVTMRPNPPTLPTTNSTNPQTKKVTEKTQESGKSNNSANTTAKETRTCESPILKTTNKTSPNSYPSSRTESVKSQSLEEKLNVSDKSSPESQQKFEKTDVGAQIDTKTWECNRTEGLSSSYGETEEKGLQKTDQKNLKDDRKQTTAHLSHKNSKKCTSSASEDKRVETQKLQKESNQTREPEKSSSNQSITDGQQDPKITTTELDCPLHLKRPRRSTKLDPSQPLDLTVKRNRNDIKNDPVDLTIPAWRRGKKVLPKDIPLDLSVERH